MLQIIETIKAAKEQYEKVPQENKIEFLSLLVNLTNKLTSLLSDFSAIPDNFLKNHHPQIINQIAAAEKRTDQGIDKIMGAAEAIMKSTEGLPSNKKEEIMKSVNEIFEASAMQDLVAQHLNEIKLRMDDLEDDFTIMSEVLSGSEGNEKNTYTRRKSEKQERADKHLLNGPPTDF